MNALLAIFSTKRASWSGCRPLSAIERMARYSQRHAQDMQQRENAGAAPPKVRVIYGREVLVALPGRVNPLPKDQA